MPRQPGRLPLDPNDPSALVHLRLPGRQYDQLFAVAQRSRMTVPEVIRRLIARDRRADDVEGDDEE